MLEAIHILLETQPRNLDNNYCNITSSPFIVGTTYSRSGLSDVAGYPDYCEV